jgi:cyclophilin family peptidyl-prolyl cis-trans isomerase
MSGEAHTKARSRARGVKGVLVLVCVLLALLLGVLVCLTRVAPAEAVSRAAPPAAERPPAAALAAPQALAQAATHPPEPLVCQPMEHTELWGDVMRPGIGPGATHAPTAAECCALCSTTRGCNVWVSCSDAGACGSACWLKWQADPTAVVKHAASAATPWTSGVLLKDYDDGTKPYPPGGATHVVLRTAAGALRIRLHPEWSLGSVTYVRKVARHGLCNAKCVFYRAEPHFLLQGALGAYIKPNNETRTRGADVAMERGDVAWAGGFAGPDFFITHVRVPGFGSSHTVWGSLDGADSFAALDALVQLPASAGPGGGMRMIVEPPAFTADSVEP